MGIVSLIFCPAAVIFAFVELMRRRSFGWAGMLSVLCCFVVLFGALQDILSRLASGDLAGVMDIYPTMSLVYLLTIAVVSAVNILTVLGGRRRARTKESNVTELTQA